jgi:hypothetical protein
LGDLEGRTRRRITKAMLHIDGAEPEMLETSALEQPPQLTLDLAGEAYTSYRSLMPNASSRGGLTTRSATHWEPVKVRCP